MRFSVPVLAIVVVLAPLGCCFTDVGCESGVVVMGIAESFDEAEVCLNEVCTLYVVGESAMIGDDFFVFRGSGQLTVLALHHSVVVDGDILEIQLFEAGLAGEERRFVIDEYTDVRPNGDNCSPHCRNATVSW